MVKLCQNMSRESQWRCRRVRRPRRRVSGRQISGRQPIQPLLAKRIGPMAILFEVHQFPSFLRRLGHANDRLIATTQATVVVASPDERIVVKALSLTPVEAAPWAAPWNPRKVQARRRRLCGDVAPIVEVQSALLHFGERAFHQIRRDFVRWENLGE